MKDKPESIPTIFMKSVFNNESTSALKEFSESLLDIAVDSVNDSELIKGIPVLNLIHASSKAIISFKDRIYIRKVARFVLESTRVTENERKDFLEKLERDFNETKKVGENLLDIIDKITSNEKIDIIGKIFKGYLREEFDYKDLISLCEIVEKIYLADLISLSKGIIDNSNLESVGIVKPIRHEDINKVTETITSEILEIIRNSTKIGTIQRDIFTVPTEISRIKTKINKSGLTRLGSILVTILREE